jgi:hypothetical protein
MTSAAMDATDMNSRVSFPALSLHARSLDIPDSVHPNKLPFSGVLTKIDEPSDAAPEGSNGKRILLTRSAAEKAIDSLLGMGVNFNPDGHSPQEKIGVIFGSEIKGNELHINGVIYAADFPIVAEQIKANRDRLGFSFEARELFTSDPNADPVCVSDLSFTGAAILLRDKAAYRTTFIHANKDTTDMSSIIDKMSAVERAKLADSLVAAASHMSETELRDTIVALTEALHSSDSIKAHKADAHRKAVLHNISAARYNPRRAMPEVDGALRRAALPPFEEIALKPQHEIKELLASARKRMTDYDFINLRFTLDRVGAFGA